jgi:hypothetical protein
MKKLRLELDALEVQSFSVDHAYRLGTVWGHDTLETNEECESIVNCSGVHSMCYSHCQTDCENKPSQCESHCPLGCGTIEA